MNLKTYLMAAIGAVGSLIASAYGGWDAAMTTLCLFMAIDYVTGLVVAGVFHKSKKSASGRLESRAGWKGLCRKGATMLIVLVAYRLDLAIGSAIIKDGVTIAFIATESISIIENVGLMGVPIPAVIINAIDVLNKKAEPPEGQ